MNASDAEDASAVLDGTAAPEVRARVLEGAARDPARYHVFAESAAMLDELAAQDPGAQPWGVAYRRQCGCAVAISDAPDEIDMESGRTWTQLMEFQGRAVLRVEVEPQLNHCPHSRGVPRRAGED